MRTVTVDGGRKLAVEEWGDPAARPVFFLHGTPTSRLEQSVDPEALHRLEARLITYDRPGYGRSDPHPGRRVVDAAADVAAIADALGLGTFAVYGASGGGPHALACAARLPDRVSRAASLVGIAPFGYDGLDWLAGMTINLDEFGAALAGRDRLEKFLAPRATAMRVDPARLTGILLAELPPADVEILRRPEVYAMFTESGAESIRHTVAGWIDDDLAFTTPWGFDLETIKVPVLIWYGERDVLAPAAHSRLLAERIPSATLARDAESGHLGAIDAHPAVLSWLLDGPQT